MINLLYTFGIGIAFAGGSIFGLIIFSRVGLKERLSEQHDYNAKANAALEARNEISREQVTQLERIADRLVEIRDKA